MCVARSLPSRTVCIALAIGRALSHADLSILCTFFVRSSCELCHCFAAAAACLWAMARLCLWPCDGSARLARAGPFPQSVSSSKMQQNCNDVEPVRSARVRWRRPPPGLLKLPLAAAKAGERARQCGKKKTDAIGGGRRPRALTNLMRKEARLRVAHKLHWRSGMATCTQSRTHTNTFTG